MVTEESREEVEQADASLQGAAFGAGTGRSLKSLKSSKTFIHKIKAEQERQAICQ